MRSVFISVVLGVMLLSSCTKETTSLTGSRVFVSYSGENQVIIEDIYADWSNGRLALIADGYDHEQLKVHLADVHNTGKVSYLSEKNISFSDGLDFESTKLEDGYINISDCNSQQVEGNFKVLLLDDINGIERRWVEGSFKVVRDRYQD